MTSDNLTTFNSLFSDWRFHIPNYQRGYAWGKPQWDALMDDLSTLTGKNEHFTGLLVLHENEDEFLKEEAHSVVKKVYDIVDGQQRMTTIVILLDEVRREMKSLDNDNFPETAADIERIYLYESGKGGRPVFKMNLDDLNKNFFEHNILETNGKDLKGTETQSHINLQKAKNYFRDYLQKKRSEDIDNYPVWLKNLYRKISSQMKVMVYLLHSEADAGVVFESMNNRGKSPNQLDLVKNYLLYLASKLGTELNSSLTGEINKTWETIFKELTATDRTKEDKEDEEEEELLKVHWFTVYDHDRKHLRKAGQIIYLIKQRFSLVNYISNYGELDNDLLYNDLKDYVRTLRSTAIAYSDLYKPDRADAFQIFASDPSSRTAIIKYSQKLLRMEKILPFRSLLIAVRIKFEDDALKYLETVKLCELYALRVLGIPENIPTGKEDVLNRLANWFFNKRITFNIMTESIRRDLLASCSDTFFQNSFSIDVDNLVSWYGKNCLTYILYEYEEKLFEPDEPIINWKTIHEGGKKSIEHILPQNPSESGDWADHFSPEMHQLYKDQIGNLTLILAGWNSSLGNKDFLLKRGDQFQSSPCYTKSDLKITNRLASLKVWSPKEIEQRQQQIADWAFIRWHVEPPPELPDDAFEALKRRAEENGIGNAFMKIGELALRLKLKPRTWKGHISYVSPYHDNHPVLKVYPYANIWVEIIFKNFPVNDHVSIELIKGIFNNRENWSLPQDKVDDFISRLEKLVHEVEGAGKV